VGQQTAQETGLLWEYCGTSRERQTPYGGFVGVVGVVISSSLASTVPLSYVGWSWIDAKMKITPETRSEKYSSAYLRAKLRFIKDLQETKQHSPGELQILNNVQRQRCISFCDECPDKQDKVTRFPRRLSRDFTKLRQMLSTDSGSPPPDSKSGPKLFVSQKNNTSSGSSSEQEIQVEPNKQEDDDDAFLSKPVVKNHRKSRSTTDIVMETLGFLKEKKVASNKKESQKKKKKENEKKRKKKHKRNQSRGSSSNDKIQEEKPKRKGGPQMKDQMRQEDSTTAESEDTSKTTEDELTLESYTESEQDSECGQEI